MTPVLNQGGPITVPLDDERHVIPPGESEQSDAVLSHKLCKALMKHKSAIMVPKDPDAGGKDMVQMRGYRLVVEGMNPKPKRGKSKAKK